VKRRHRSSQQSAAAAWRLRELLATSVAGGPRPETHRSVLWYRAPAGDPSFASHLYVELDGDVSPEYQKALAKELARCLELARADAGSAFCMLGEEDPLPTMQWSIEHPARARIDIHTTGGARLWAVERLVCSCVEQAVERCEVPSQGAAPGRWKGARVRAAARPGPEVAQPAGASAKKRDDA
jgi:hypothetical protein